MQHNTQSSPRGSWQRAHAVLCHCPRPTAPLQASGATSTLHLVPGKTHTSFLLEDPMRGGHDMLTDLVLEAVLGPAASGGGGEGEGEAEAGGQGQQGSGNGRPQRPQVVYSTLCPGFLCDLAGKVCPF